MEHDAETLISLHHEIRTPLARLRFLLASAQQRGLEPEVARVMDAQIDAIVRFLDQLRRPTDVQDRHAVPADPASAAGGRP